MKTNLDKKQNIPFKRYFESLSKEEKRLFFFEITKYISSSHFYALLRDNKFTLLQKEKIEELTKQKFNWYNEEV